MVAPAEIREAVARAIHDATKAERELLSAGWPTEIRRRFLRRQDKPKPIREIAMSEADAAIAAYRRALAAAGLVIVPKMPSKEMLAAGVAAIHEHWTEKYGAQALLQWQAALAKAEEEMDEKR